MTISTQSDVEKEYIDPFLERQVKILIYAVSFCILVIFVAFIYLYSNYGGPWVDSLDEHVGEIVSQRATSMASAGFVDEGVDLYRQALSVPFDDPNQFQLTSERFAKLLLKVGNFSEARDVAETAVLRKGKIRWMNYNLLFNAYIGLGADKDAENAGRRWLAAAKEAADYNQTTWATYHTGLALKKQGRIDEALSIHLEGFAFQSSVQNGLAAAQFLHTLGRGKEALEYLDYVIKAESDRRPRWRREKAVELKSEIESSL